MNIDFVTIITAVIVVVRFAIADHDSNYIVIWLLTSFFCNIGSEYNFN